VVVADGTQKWWTDRAPKNRHPPLDLDALDFIALEKAKDALGYVVGGIGGGRAGINPDPYNDGTRNVLLVGFVGDEASLVNGRVANLFLIRSRTRGPTVLQTALSGVP
jgi:hypothetical protein